MVSVFALVGDSTTMSVFWGDADDGRSEVFFGRVRVVFELVANKLEDFFLVEAVFSAGGLTGVVFFVDFTGIEIPLLQLAERPVRLNTVFG